jgi:hypothetical protein
MLFSAPSNKNHKSMVSITYDDGRKVMFQFCKDFQQPMQAKYGIDDVQSDGANGERRGQTVVVRDPSAQAALKAMDEEIVRIAVERSKEWFGQKVALTKEAVLLRYQPMIKDDEKPSIDGDMLVKFRVKVPPAKFPTKMFLLTDEPNTYQEMTSEQELNDVVKILEKRGCLLAPLLSAPLLWFMGGGTKFGVTLQAEEMVVTSAPAPSALCNFSSITPYEAVKRGAEESTETLAGDTKKIVTGDAGSSDDVNVPEA